jgi:hypothetical protein
MAQDFKKVFRPMSHVSVGSSHCQVQDFKNVLPGKIRKALERLDKDTMFNDTSLIMRWLVDQSALICTRADESLEEMRVAAVDRHRKLTETLCEKVGVMERDLKASAEHAVKKTVGACVATRAIVNADAMKVLCRLNDVEDSLVILDGRTSEFSSTMQKCFGEDGGIELVKDLKKYTRGFKNFKNYTKIWEQLRLLGDDIDTLHHRQKIMNKIRGLDIEAEEFIAPIALVRDRITYAMEKARAKRDAGLSDSEASFFGGE